MANSKISALTGATTPLAGTEVLPIVQSSATKKVAVSDLTAGRAVSALSQTTTNDSSFNGISVGRGGGSVAGNTRAGANALLNNTTGANVTGVGANANRGNTTGSNNTAVGADAGYSQQGGSGNTLIGSDVGSQDTAFDQLTAVGFRAGKFNQGDNNTFVGAYAGYEVTTGSNNTVLGGYNGNQGGVDIRTSSGNVVLSDGVGNIRAYFDGTDWKITSGNLIISDSAKGLQLAKGGEIAAGGTVAPSTTKTVTITMSGTGSYAATISAAMNVYGGGGNARAMWMVGGDIANNNSGATAVVGPTNSGNCVISAITLAAGSISFTMQNTNAVQNGRVAITVTYAQSDGNTASIAIT